MSGVEFTWPGPRPFSLYIDEFSLQRGKRVLLVGPSGSGKSTFLSLLCGVVLPNRGRVIVLDQDLSSLSGGARDTFRAEHFGIIFQMFNLLPYGSVRDNVMLPLHFSSLRRARAARLRPAEKEAERLLETLGLDCNEAAATAQLSVGQQQRVAAARALIGAPELIVADEPTSSLDRDRQSAFLDLLFAEAERDETTILMVSHDETLGARFDEVLHLDAIAKAKRGAAA